MGGAIWCMCMSSEHSEDPEGQEMTTVWISKTTQRNIHALKRTDETMDETITAALRALKEQEADRLENKVDL